MKKFIILTLLASVFIHCSALTTGEEADSAYNKENYREAIELYTRSIAEDGMSANAYYISARLLSATTISAKR